MELREITQADFDLIVDTVRKQGGRSIDLGRGCVYRSPDGRKCHAGILIPDEDYNPSFEGSPVYCLPYFEERFSLTGLRQLRELQSIHDRCAWSEDFFKEWTTQMREFARNNGFSFHEEGSI